MVAARFETSDGVSLSYEDSGSGLPVLCLPGLTRNARDFDDLATILPTDVRMIRLTSRGRGQSDWDPNFANYAVPIEARDALELLDHLGLDQTAVFGTSRGGILSMVLALTAKPRLLGVLLNDIGPEIAPQGLEVIYDYIGRRPAGADYAAVGQALKASMGADFPDLTDARWQVLAERWFVKDAEGVGLRYDPRLRDAVLAQAQAEQPDLWPFFDGFEGLPLAVVRGENSNLLTAETLERMQRRRPDMIARTVPNRGHVPFLDEPQSAEAVHALISALRG
ncbi:MAG: alpha/beta hydrolase [Pseudomonadota bacterium]